MGQVVFLTGATRLSSDCRWRCVLHKPTGYSPRLWGADPCLIHQRNPIGVFDVTIAMAALTEEGYIVTVSDRMISYDDITQAEDNAVLKARSIADKWGMMFAANDARLFYPIFDKLYDRLRLKGALSNADMNTIKEEAAGAYQDVFDSEFTARFLGRYRIKDISDFRKNGFIELGKDVFGDLNNELMKFDLGIQLLCFGYDGVSVPHIVEIENPGRPVDHDILGYAVIGSGYWMASASLRRRPARRDLQSTIYRLLEAKFSAETARGVGRSTTVLTFNPEIGGRPPSMRSSEIEAVRAAWNATLYQPDPEEATKGDSRISGGQAHSGQTGTSESRSNSDHGTGKYAAFRD